MGDSKCLSDDCSVFNAVLGRLPTTARAARAENGPCGLTAKFFSPKPEPTWFERNFGRVMFIIIGTAAAMWVTDAWRTILLYGVG